MLKISCFLSMKKIMIEKGMIKLLLGCWELGARKKCQGMMSSDRSSAEVLSYHFGGSTCRE